MKSAFIAGTLALTLAASASAQDGQLTRSFWDRYGTTNTYTYETYTWPAIGTPTYSESCEIIRFAEDGWALAYCTEDGATYTFDPDSASWAVETATYTFIR